MADRQVSSPEAYKPRPHVSPKLAPFPVSLGFILKPLFGSTVTRAFYFKRVWHSSAVSSHLLLLLTSNTPLLPESC